MSECPICAEEDDLDFHHWIYSGNLSRDYIESSEEKGVKLCRDCHTLIHSPDGARPTDVEKGDFQSFWTGLRWQRYSILFLPYIYLYKTGKIPEKEEMIEKMNIPDEFEKYVEEAIEKPPLVRFEGKDLLAGVKDDSLEFAKENQDGVIEYTFIGKEKMKLTPVVNR